MKKYGEIIGLQILSVAITLILSIFAGFLVCFGAVQFSTIVQCYLFGMCFSAALRLGYCKYQLNKYDKCQHIRLGDLKVFSKREFFARKLYNQTLLGCFAFPANAIWFILFLVWVAGGMVFEYLSQLAEKYLLGYFDGDKK